MKKNFDRPKLSPLPVVSFPLVKLTERLRTEIIISFFFLSFFVLGLTFPSDPQKVTLHHMAEVVVTWCQYQADHWPKSGKRRHFLIFLTYGKQMK